MEVTKLGTISTERHAAVTMDSAFYAGPRRNFLLQLPHRSKAFGVYDRDGRLSERVGECRDEWNPSQPPSAPHYAGEGGLNELRQGVGHFP